MVKMGRTRRNQHGFQDLQLCKTGAAPYSQTGIFKYLTSHSGGTLETKYHVSSPHDSWENGMMFVAHTSLQVHV